MLVDLSDPSSPQPSARGTDGGTTVTVKSDPVDVVIDSVTGLAFVANRTDHDISVLDTTEDEIKVINPWPYTTVSAAVYSDNSGTGGQARLTKVDILGDRLLLDDVWTLTWAEGTWRIWVRARTDCRARPEMAATDGALRFATTPWSWALHRRHARGCVADGRSQLQRLDRPNAVRQRGLIWGAASGEYLGDSIGDTIPTLEPGAREWMGWIGGPNVAPD